MNYQRSLLFFFIALYGCNSKPDHETNTNSETKTYPEASNTAPPPTRSESVFRFPSDSIGAQPSYRSSYTLNELWDEAEDVKNEAEQLLGEAEDVGCDEAMNAAQNAIDNGDECINTRNYNDAATYLEDAQSDLSNAQGYLEDCTSDHEESGEADKYR